MVLLSYAIHKADPVFIVGQSCGFLIYSRNIYLIKKESKSKKSGVIKIERTKLDLFTFITKTIIAQQISNNV